MSLLDASSKTKLRTKRDENLDAKEKENARFKVKYVFTNEQYWAEISENTESTRPMSSIKKVTFSKLTSEV